ncbi:DUF1501 domain-containing protein [Xylophilus rhododendri]|uniref:DUF1501 domain-containing protein n=1 Tax=Xylophilus rhododendri TaxID=2697032 RepID=A0A857J0J7_9BURK|nr:DUF1501 domain-containing protein [Xylophilus rhododendri]QHI97246.1 DUF1501 domain-containing protein [Xylophilus rhododendri]
MDRRELLRRAGLAAAAMPLASRAWALPAGQADARFLLVFLRGGYDANSLLVPTGSDFYYASRPTIAIKRPVAEGGTPDPQAAIALPGDGASGWGLHPSVAERLLPFWRQGQLAFVPFAGTDDLSRSHFETQDSIEAGLPIPGDRSAPGSAAAALRGSGFLNRLASTLGAQAAPVAFTDVLPASMAGPAAIPNVSLKGSLRAPFDERQSAVYAGMYRGSRFSSVLAEGLELRQTVAQEVEAEAARQRDRSSAMAADPAMAARMQEMQAASRQAISARGFELEARRMAQLMRERYTLGFIDVGGWDTHVNQGGAQGQLANLLQNLGSGLATFAQELGPAWDRTVVVVVSEFGRTFRENGTRGTDHGHGSAYWVAGGGLRGGRLAGEQAVLRPGALNQDRDFPVLNEYRAVIGGLLRRQYGLDAVQLARIFPGSAPLDLGLL